jgi:hypothetical protein
MSARICDMLLLILAGVIYGGGLGAAFWISTKDLRCPTKLVWRRKPENAADVVRIVACAVLWLATLGWRGELPWTRENVCGGCWGGGE